MVLVSRLPSLPARPSLRSDLLSVLLAVVVEEERFRLRLLEATDLTAETGSLIWTLPPPAALSFSRTALLSMRKVWPPCLQIY